MQTDNELEGCLFWALVVVAIVIGVAGAAGLYFLLKKLIP